MVSKKEWVREVHRVYEQMRKHREQYHTVVNDLDIVVFPDVFSPAYFTDSAWFAEVIPEIVGKRRLLEIGTGTGIVALSAALAGASVTATDINPAAIRNAKENFTRYGVDISLYEGDMYGSIHQQKFDVIFWNHPFNRARRPVEDILLRAGFDYNYEGLEKYICGAQQYFTENGIVLLGTGNFADIDEMRKITSQNDYSLVLMRKCEVSLIEGSGISNEYRVYRFEKMKK